LRLVPKKKRGDDKGTFLSCSRRRSCSSGPEGGKRRKKGSRLLVSNNVLVGKRERASFFHLGGEKGGRKRSIGIPIHSLGEKKEGLFPVRRASDLLLVRKGIRASLLFGLRRFARKRKGSMYEGEGGEGKKARRASLSALEKGI